MWFIVGEVTCAGIESEHLFHILVIAPNSTSLGILIVLDPFDLLDILPLRIDRLHPRFYAFGIFNAPLDGVHFFERWLDALGSHCCRTQFFARWGCVLILVVFPRRQKNQRAIVLEMLLAFVPPLLLIHIREVNLRLFGCVLNLAHMMVISLENVVHDLLHRFERFSVGSPHCSILLIFWF